MGGSISRPALTIADQTFADLLLSLPGFVAGPGIIASVPGKTAPCLSGAWQEQ